MTEGPWSSVKREPPPELPSRPANWGFYLAITLGLNLVAGLLMAALMAMAGGQLPPGVDMVVNLILLVAIVSIAGNRWLKGAGGRWSHKDRHRLAFAYTAVNGVMSLIALGIVIAVLSSGMGSELAAQLGLPQEMLAPGMFALVAVFVVIFLALALLIQYGITRLVLFHIVNKNARPDSDVSKEFA